MRFDTEEAFFKAVYTHSKLSPSDISNRVTYESVDNVPKIRNRICTDLVAMMRGAFFVHQRCNGQIGGEESLLEYRLGQCAESLPDGWKVVVMAEKGSLRMDLYDPQDRPVLMKEEGGMSSAIVDAALHAQSSFLASQNILTPIEYIQEIEDDE